MNELAKEWIRRLRSGEYEQGSGQLERLGSEKPPRSVFCCLGVAGKLLSEKGLTERVDRGLVSRVSYGGCSTTLIYEDLAKFGLSNTRIPLVYLPKGWRDSAYAAGVICPGECVMLESMNDTLKMTFEEIADVLEKALEGKVEA